MSARAFVQHKILSVCSLARFPSEAITSAVYCGDVFRAVFGERFSQCRDAFVQTVLFDEVIAPDFLQQLVFADQVSALTHERQQRVEGLRFKLHRRAVPQQQSFGGIQPKATEFVELFCRALHKTTARLRQGFAKKKLSAS